MCVGNVRKLVKDYFINEPLYPENIFRQRFHMHKHIFLRIVESVTTEDEFFTQKSDATRRMGAYALQKCIAAIRMLAYGSSFDANIDEYLKIALSTARKCLLHFVEGVVARFGPEYLREANQNGIEHLLHEE
ncbi:uncharacterized protein LOC125494679 [Beta vulgaris subsp. vulgaris]|uniref:uncharacterized protein LOC125494679 n=1 Tax=Beta vulgaris subsp. vulgaris TaxID=3555 RepID=UPI002036ABBA|nr:uncharacterized protein LOC125494679 [Beta vulgaris subsp. vulgaris]